MPLTPKEEEQIRERAEKKYPMHYNGRTEHASIVDRQKSAIERERQAYISGRIEEREAAKPLVELLERAAKANVGRPSQLIEQFEKFQEEIQQALSIYNKDH